MHIVTLSIQKSWFLPVYVGIPHQFCPGVCEGTHVWWPWELNTLGNVFVRELMGKWNKKIQKIWFHFCKLGGEAEKPREWKRWLNESQTSRWQNTWIPHIYTFTQKYNFTNNKRTVCLSNSLNSCMFTFVDWRIHHNRDPSEFSTALKSRKSLPPETCPPKSPLTQSHYLWLCHLQSRPCGWVGYRIHWINFDHVNSIVIVGILVWIGAQTQAAHLLHLSFEALTEHVVDHGVVDSGALGEHARQQTDFRRDGAAVAENRPQAHQAVRRPAAYEAYADQDSNLPQR